MTDEPENITLEVLKKLRAELADMRQEMRTEFAGVRQEMGAEFADVRTEIGGLRQEMRTGFAEVRQDIALLQDAVVKTGDAVTSIAAVQELHTAALEALKKHTGLVKA